MTFVRRECTAKLRTVRGAVHGLARIYGIRGKNLRPVTGVRFGFLVACEQLSLSENA